ncbi:MAG: hypothetical protein ACRDNJ_05465 [Solirubrobacteraceae bacterium]
MPAVAAIALAVGLQAGAGTAAAKHGAARTPAAKRSVARTPAAKRGTAPTLSANRAAARFDAARLLSRLMLPSGAARDSGEPAGDGAQLRPLPLLIGAFKSVTAHAWWTLPGGPNAAVAYIRTHPPAGARLTGTGSGSNGHGQSMRSLDFDWGPVTGVLGVRHLRVTVTALPGGDTGLLAESQSQWIVPRPAGERVPRGVRVVDVQAGPRGDPTKIVRTVTGRAEIHRLIALVDSLEIVQPVEMSCPSLTPSAAWEISLTFRVRPGGPALARLDYADYLPRIAPSTECTPVQFAVRGHRGPPLLGGDIVRRLQRILGARLI